MILLNGFWSPGRGILLWGADADRPVGSPSQSVTRARLHPFAATSAAVADIHPGTPLTATLLLPSLQKSPLDPPELARATPRPAPKRPPMLLPWTVPAILLDPAQLEALSPQARYGSTVTHLRAVAAFAADLATRGRMLPTLVREAVGPVARWRPVVTGPDAVTLHDLVLAMPPAGRAERTHLGDVDGEDPAHLVTDALDALCDRAVRNALGGSTLMPPRRGRTPRRRPAVEAFVAALSAPDGLLGDDTDEDSVDALASALAGWDAIGEAPVGPARAMFRLTEPSSETDDTDNAPWRLVFLLRSTVDPSLQVEAEQVWARPEGLRRWIARPAEVLLTELGRASSVVPGLEPALRVARPSGWDLDVEAAHAFLTDGAAQLVAAGFEVQLPSWWGDSRRRLGLVASGRSTPSDQAVVAGGLSREVLAGFQWTLAVGEDLLDEDEIAELVAAKAPLVRLRGRWVAVDPDRLRKGLDFLSRPRRDVSAGELLDLARDDTDALPLPLLDTRVTGWVGDLLAGTAEATVGSVEPPPWFAAQLRPYQGRGLSWLTFMSGLGLGACLADDMGLGKTVQLLALEATDRQAPSDDQQHRPSLLLCPMSLVGNWQREAARFAPDLRLYAHHGTGRLRGEELAAHLAGVDLVVTTYGTAARDIEELAAYHWHRLTLDEAQAVKNSQATASKAVRRLEARHRVALTGTPVENRLSELWALMDVLNPGLLGTAERFRARFAVPVERHGDAEAAQLLRRLTRPYLLRRVKTDPTIIDDLPEKIEIVQDYRLTPEQASLYRTVVDDMMARIEDSDGIERRGNVLAAMTKLKQVCNHPAQLLHDGSAIGGRSGKVTRLEEILTEILAEGDKALCFTQFAEFGSMLVPHLSARFDTEVLFLHGGTSRRHRDEMVARFQSADGPSAFLLSLKAGGTGLNLTAANHVVHLDRWWNPAVENQATDRAFRIGQRRTVQVRKFTCAGTLEERIDAMIRSKRALADLVVGDGEGWLTELTTSELRALFTLGSEAVGE